MLLPTIPLHEKMDLLRERQWGHLLAIQNEPLKLLADLVKAGIRFRRLADNRIALCALAYRSGSI
jgi:hypothetical protein